MAGAGVAALAAYVLAGPASACDLKTAIGVSRIVEIDTRNGPLFGSATRYNHQPSFLREKEIVLTFDDGPAPDTTAAVLAALAEQCTRATFFPVGRQALRHPETMRAIVEAGHTIGSHTWSHPKNMGQMDVGKARDEIERGFAAVTYAAGQPIAPFFRFTGLNDDRELLTYLQIRKVATFTVDVITDDSFTSGVSTLVRNTLERTKRKNGGILLFHDLKKVTARAMPVILRELKNAGFKVVHIVPAEPFRTDRGYHSQFAKLFPEAAKRHVAPRETGSIDGAAASSPTPVSPKSVSPKSALPKSVVDPGLAGIPTTRLVAEQALFDGTTRPVEPLPETAASTEPVAGGERPPPRAWWQVLPSPNWLGGRN